MNSTMWFTCKRNKHCEMVLVIQLIGWNLLHLRLMLMMQWLLMICNYNWARLLIGYILGTLQMILLEFTQTALNNKKIEPNIVCEAENIDLPILNCEKYFFVKVVIVSSHHWGNCEWTNFNIWWSWN